MCKIGLGVTFRVGNRRKPLKNFEQVKCFCLFVFFGFVRFALVRVSNTTPTTKIIAPGFCMMVMIIIIQYITPRAFKIPAIKFNTFQQPIESGISSIVQYLFLSVIALLFWSCKKVSKPQNHECFDWFITSCKKAIQKRLGFWIPRCRFRTPFQWNFDSKFQY